MSSHGDAVTHIVRQDYVGEEADSFHDCRSSLTRTGD